MLYPTLARVLLRIKGLVKWPGTSGTLPTPSASLSSLTLDAASIDDDGVDFLTATITLLDAGSVPIVGYTPTVLVSPSSGISIYDLTATNGSGVATCKINGTVVGTKTVSASFNSVTLDDTPTFDVDAVTAGAFDFTNSFDPDAFDEEAFA